MIKSWLAALMIAAVGASPATPGPTVYVDAGFPIKSPPRFNGFPPVENCSRHSTIIEGHTFAEASIPYLVVKGNTAIAGVNVHGRGVVGDASFTSLGSVVLYMQLDDQTPTVTDGFTLNKQFNVSFPGLKPGRHQFLTSLIDSKSLNDPTLVPVYWSRCFTVP